MGSSAHRFGLALSRSKVALSGAFGRGGEDWARFAKPLRRFSPPLPCRLPKPNAGSAAVLFDELGAGGFHSSVFQELDHQLWPSSNFTTATRME
jgi:hypothetical protein